MSDLPTPINRNEQFLNAIANGDPSDLPTPITREEQYLDYIAKNGGGSGDGDMKKSVYDSDLAVANAGGIGAFVGNAVLDKVDKVEGKGLSTNDYSDTEKGKVAANTSAIEAIVNEYGAKNLLSVTASTQTLNSVTCTPNADGSITMTVAAGTKYGARAFTIGTVHLKAGTYKLSGCPTGGKLWSSYVLAISVNATEYYDEGNGIEFTISSDSDATVSITEYGASSDGFSKTFYPMIRDARITDPTYVPYAMTNRELTERMIKSINRTLTITNMVSDSNSILGYGGSAQADTSGCTNILAIVINNGSQSNGYKRCIMSVAGTLLIADSNESSDVSVSYSVLYTD